MDRVLSVPELLGNIIGFLDTRSRLSCALVCKSWLQIALDVLWRTLDSPVPLLALLGPLQQQQRSLDKVTPLPARGFQRPIRVEDWNVFDRYARRVRVLILDFRTLPDKRIARSRVFVEVAQKRRALTLLPSLVRLEVTPAVREDLAHALLFMGQSIRELLFRYPDPDPDSGFASGAEWGEAVDDGEAISEFFKECALRMPRMKAFELEILSDSASWSVALRMQKFLSPFIARMRELERFSVPLYTLTAEIAEVLAGLPELRIVAFGHPSEAGVGKREDVLPFLPSPFTVSVGSAGNALGFPALVDLSFSATFADAARFLELDGIAPNLSCLFIHSPELESADGLHRLLVSLSARRARLSQLVLSSVALPIRKPMRDEDGHEIDRVTLQTLLPLLDFPDLKYFEVVYHRSFKLSNADVEELLDRWPSSASLEALYLCSDPLLREKPTLTLEVLPIIAKYCPKLQQVSLYLDTHVPASLLSCSDSDPITLTPTRFSPSLDQINFGTSPLDESDISNFSLYLSSLLPPTSNCDISALCGVSWLLEHQLTRVQSLDQDRSDPGPNSNAYFAFGMHPAVVARWQEVSWVLKLLITAREQERTRAKGLEREARDLAMRVKILEDMRLLGLPAGVPGQPPVVAKT